MGLATPATTVTETEARVQPKRADARATPLWAFLVATWFGLGTLRPGPGTWASAVAALMWWAVATMIPSAWHAIILVVLIAIAVVTGIRAATMVARASGEKDPQMVVIDEVAGQWISLLFAPLTWKTVLLGFILFRGFDILKPPPVRQLERLPEGTGIVADDLAAGGLALVVMQLVMHLRLLSQ